jgi:hypothetical protein
MSLVPMRGIRKKVVNNVPNMLPIVDMPYILPETLPALEL